MLEGKEKEIEIKNEELTAKGKQEPQDVTKEHKELRRKGSVHDKGKEGKRDVSQREFQAKAK